MGKKNGKTQSNSVEMTTFTTKIEEELKTKMKIIAAKEKTTMTDFLNEAVRYKIYQWEKENKPIE